MKLRKLEKGSAKMKVSETNVFIFAGFLDCGKTTALQGLLLREDNAYKDRTVIICTEFGENEYYKPWLENRNIALIDIEEEEELSTEKLNEIADEYKPEFVFIEFNGMWDLKAFLEKQLPDDWYVANVFSLVDATMYDIYLKNMRQTIMNPLCVSDVILFNRCDDSFKKGDVRRSLKLLNPRADVFFTKKDGSVDEDFEEFIIENSGGIVNITEEIFSQWFIDCIENTEKYYGKTVRFTGKVSNGEGLCNNQFYIGRYAVVCCEADAQFIGFLAEYDKQIPENGEWIEITATLEKGEIEGDKSVIVLKTGDYKIVDPPKIVYLYF
ncbi:MAG: GTPase [Lachnospiraceae bacterium]|nr:GTPase [Lachnospiraceae bacterium]